MTTFLGFAFAVMCGFCLGEFVAECRLNRKVANLKNRLWDAEMRLFDFDMRCRDGRCRDA